MKKLGTRKQLEELRTQLPTEAFEHCFDTLLTLDEAYGDDRNIDTDLGGFVLLVEETVDFELLKNYNIDILTDTFEFVDIVETMEDTYISILYLLSSDFGIKIFTNKELVPNNIIEHWEV